MGWARVHLEVTGSVSAHNSDQDIADDAAWEEFCHRVEAIAREHRYEALKLDVYAGGR